jgi:hypothetical protein
LRYELAASIKPTFETRSKLRSRPLAGRAKAKTVCA